MDRLTNQKRAQIAAALVEEVSINSTTRMTGVSKHTILNLLEDLGCACAEYHNRVVRDLTVGRVEVDEIWQFCYAKEKNVPADKQGKFGYGDVWTTTGRGFSCASNYPCWRNSSIFELLRHLPF
jgi:hypothetical protein